MKLTRARVKNYRSIDDSTWVQLEDVTALVGKNESGKTAFLQALRKINSISGDNDRFNIRDFPRKGYIKYKKIHEKSPETVVQAEFELSDTEVAEIESKYGANILLNNKVIVSKDYKNDRHWDFELRSGVTSSPLLGTSSLFPPFPTPSLTS